ncbi:TetR family transcriptional regulator [Microlunatus endophyticus]|uniref:TetR family transcriptional regulator n=1 Tax=Microlunatus endophyticus TaxID=1716077 RepID=A0A917W6C8_9ACTN|nr:TetR family transcriptional regulator [Microlunatus endophyticus]GGL69150.1 TetR family transcriptional regulator [Microlunatus endophyticus]
MSPSRRPSRGRGQHAGLDAPTILRTAIDLADRDGLAALSMRRLGAELDVEAMAIYHHFPSKDALLDAIVGELVAQAAVSGQPTGDWQSQLRCYALSFFERLTEHPNLLPLVLTRPAMTGGSLQVMESLVGVLCDAGFAPERSLDIVYALARLVLIHAALDTGTDQSLAAGDPAGQLAGVSPDEFPVLAEAAHASLGRPATYRLEFAVDALIIGFAQGLRSPRKRPGRAAPPAGTSAASPRA